MTRDLVREALVDQERTLFALAERAAERVREYDRRSDPVLFTPDEVAYRAAEDQLERERAGF